MQVTREEVNLVDPTGVRTTIIKVVTTSTDVSVDAVSTLEWTEVETTFKGDDGYWTRNKDGTFTDPQGIGDWRATF